MEVRTLSYMGYLKVNYIDREMTQAPCASRYRSVCVLI